MIVQHLVWPYDARENVRLLDRLARVALRTGSVAAAKKLAPWLLPSPLAGAAEWLRIAGSCRRIAGTTPDLRARFIEAHADYLRRARATREHGRRAA